MTTGTVEYANEHGLYYCSTCATHYKSALVVTGDDGYKKRQCMQCGSAVVILSVNHTGNRLSELEKKVEELQEEVRVLRGYILGGG